MRRTIVALGAVATLLTLLGCGGLGVNIGSGAKGSGNVAHVTISVISGPNVPIVLRGHFLTLLSVAYDSRNFVTSTQGAIWTATGAITLFDPSCSTIVGTFGVVNGVFTQTTTTPTQTICVFGGTFGDSSAARPAAIKQSIATPNNVTATVSGVTGSVVVTVTQ